MSLLNTKYFILQFRDYYLPHSYVENFFYTQAMFFVVASHINIFLLSQNHDGRRSSSSTRRQEGEEGGPCPDSHLAHEGAPEAEGAGGQGPRVSVYPTTLMNAY